MLLSFSPLPFPNLLLSMFPSVLQQAVCLPLGFKHYAIKVQNVSPCTVYNNYLPYPVSCCTTRNNPRILHTIPNSLSPKIIIELNRLLVSPYVLELPPFMYCNHLPYLFPIFCCPCSLLYHTKFAFAKRFHNLYTV